MAETLTEGHGRCRKRCYSGCAVCRARKVCCIFDQRSSRLPLVYRLSNAQVKCDERPGGCSNCERLSLKCPGNNLEQLSSVEELRLPPQAGAKRIKIYRSCGQCRASKTRCSGDRPVCLRCRRKNQDCIYNSNPDPAWKRVVFGDSSNWANFNALEDVQTLSVNDGQLRPDFDLDSGPKASHDTRAGVGWDSIEW
jgi:hypothetical protein